MASRYKVIGKIEHHTPKHLLGIYNLPEEAHRLIEDIQTLELIIHLIDQLDHRTLDDDENETGTNLRRMSWLIGCIRNKARDRLRYEYLGGKPIKPRKKLQTIADIWELLAAVQKLNERERESLKKTEPADT